MSELLSKRKLIRAVQDYLIALIEKGEKHVEITEFNVDIQEIIENLPKDMEDWVDAENPPEKGKYVLLSFANFSLPAIGRYEEDEEGGNYYIGDDEKSCLEEDLYVNAWMPLPELYEKNQGEEQMNDRYLFKAKQKNWKQLPKEEWWVHGLLTKMWGQLHIIKPDDENTAYPIEESTICQCIGLKDKNKKLIWENDIVKASCSEELCAVGKVEQKIDGTWIMYPACRNGEMWYLLPDEKGHTTVDVRGNIFDNPELLEVQQ